MQQPDKEVVRQSLPDVAEQSFPENLLPIDRVGMAGVEMPVLIYQDKKPVLVPAKISILVNLVDPEAKGIHMSRLYVIARDHLSEKGISHQTLKSLLIQFRDSQKQLSSGAEIVIRFTHLRQQKALISDNYGYRYYPVTLRAHFSGKTFHFERRIRVTYSSTCPCSTALSRQFLADRFKEQFDTGELIAVDQVANWLKTSENSFATPHAQRSYADVTTRSVEGSSTSSIDELIDVVESAVQTPVQAAVKREDEQAFAVRNGQNQMFCEDAVRRIAAAIDSSLSVHDWRVKVTHCESLHPHDAVAICVKGIKGGLTP